jgi:hypothetical protein
MPRIYLLSFFLNELPIECFQDPLHLLVSFLRHPNKLHVVLLEIFGNTFCVFKGWKNQIIQKLICRITEGRKTLIENGIIVHKYVIKDSAGCYVV